MNGWAMVSRTQTTQARTARPPVPGAEVPRSEQGLPGRRGRLETEMREGRGGRRAPPRGALDQSLLEQVGLVHVLDRVLLLPHRDRERREADGSARELEADRLEDP